MNRFGISGIVFLTVILTSCPITPREETPRLTRIEVAPSAVLFTASGQVHTFSARAFDQNNQPIQASFSWGSSDPAAVSVSASGEARSLVGVGSAQITASADGISSSPASVIVAEPVSGAVLVQDAQVFSGPEPLELTTPPATSPQSRLTVTGVSGLAPGTILLASEAKPIAGRVVTVADAGGGRQEVVLEEVSLPELLKTYSISGQTRIQQETSSPVSAVGLRPLADAPDISGSWGPLKCTLGGSLTLGAASMTYTLKPDLNVVYQLDSLGASVKLSGTLVATFKGTVKLAGNLTGTASCKLETARIVLPIGGALAAVIGLQVPMGVKANLSVTAQTPSIELGVENKTTAQVTAGFACSVQTNQCNNLSSAEINSATKPILTVSDNLKDFRLEGNVGLYGYVGLDVGSPIGQRVGVTKPFGLFDAFLGARQDFKFASRDAQAHDPKYASKYGLKLYGELGFGSGAKEAMKELIGTDVTFKQAVVFEKPLDTSPFGTDQVDKFRPKVGEATTFTINLDPKSVNYVSIGYNVESVRLYRISLNPNTGLLEDKPVATLPASEGQTQFTYTWTPGVADKGLNKFYAFVVTKPLSLALEVADNSELVVNVDAQSYTGNVTFETKDLTNGLTYTVTGNVTLSFSQDTTGSYDITGSAQVTTTLPKCAPAGGAATIAGWMNLYDAAHPGPDGPNTYDFNFNAAGTEKITLMCHDDSFTPPDFPIQWVIYTPPVGTGCPETSTQSEPFTDIKHLSGKRTLTCVSGYTFTLTWDFSVPTQ